VNQEERSLKPLYPIPYTLYPIPYLPYALCPIPYTIFAMNLAQSPIPYSPDSKPEREASITAWPGIGIDNCSPRACMFRASALELGFRV
jgi:hypothetical protein